MVKDQLLTARGSAKKLNVNYRYYAGILAALPDEYQPQKAGKALVITPQIHDAVREVVERRRKQSGTVVPA